MLTPQTVASTRSFLKSLVHRDGAAGEVPGVQGALQSTLSVCKALQFFAVSPPNPDGILSFVSGRYDSATGGYCDESGATTPLATAAALLLLNTIGARRQLAEVAPKALRFMSLQAQRREEHFMLLGVVEECALQGAEVSGSVAFFRAGETAEGTFGEGLLDNAIGASALMRVGEPLRDPSAVRALLLAAQRPEGGFAQGEEAPDLWTTYCVMRALALLKARPDEKSLISWIRSKVVRSGGFSAAGGEASAGASYQALAVLEWAAAPVMAAARNGDTPFLEEWLAGGGDPDLADLQGWTPLMAAAVRGRGEAVELLLSGGRGGKGADPSIRLAAADALPLFWAGQSGDLRTVQALLKAAPGQLFEISQVNGHTVLLQAAFFGSQRHRDVAAWILENVGSILGLDEESRKEEIAAARKRLTAACNVRGYTGFTMSRLWGNREIAALFERHDASNDDEKRGYLQELLGKIELPVPEEEPQRGARLAADRFAAALERIFSAAAALPPDDPAKLQLWRQDAWRAVRAVVESPQFDLNARGGALQQTPLIMAVTGVDTLPEAAAFRAELTGWLLDLGSDPDLPEIHPMGVDAVIRTAVLNHFDLLRMIAGRMPPLALAAALNERPPINGQTALQDTVHRALTSTGAVLQSHLDQIRWCISAGARCDIEDATGVSPRMLAQRAADDRIYQEQAAAVLAALGDPPPRPFPPKPPMEAAFQEAPGTP